MCRDQSQKLKYLKWGLMFRYVTVCILAEMYWRIRESCCLKSPCEIQSISTRMQGITFPKSKTFIVTVARTTSLTILIPGVPKLCFDIYNHFSVSVLHLLILHPAYRKYADLLQPLLFRYLFVIQIPKLFKQFI